MPLQWALFRQQGSREHRRQRTALKPSTEGENGCCSRDRRNAFLYSPFLLMCVFYLFSRAAVALGSSLSRGCASYTDVTEHELYKSAASQWCYIHFFDAFWTAVKAELQLLSCTSQRFCMIVVRLQIPNGYQQNII